MLPYQRIFHLPFGFVVTFVFTGESMWTNWEPDVPKNRIRRPRAKRRLLAAYQDARAEFARDIATMRQGSVLIAEDDGKALNLTVVKPETLQ
ncbi:hypothetical protein GOA97_18955 [Sinorhizobium meliloti]|nr:hypothetical protein [Sinorhizobium meliloti]MDW9656539.1 hypothetical protein [Sinorhizobium meliloti]MDW9916349.1 hypothetical protein [Sinorhizobium meliloti]MDW9939662.1 hypothetical protein [Sinorhizobium meliloti]MDW9945881.1 hypothetical protein [Sinorhizobium meliloti]